jgi:hypothetical protein
LRTLLRSRKLVCKNWGMTGSAIARSEKSCVLPIQPCEDRSRVLCLRSLLLTACVYQQVPTTASRLIHHPRPLHAGGVSKLLMGLIRSGNFLAI